MSKEQLNLYTAKTFTGLENILASELEFLGAQKIKIRKRAVLFQGDLELLYKSNLWSRTALKILQNIDKFYIKNENDLYHKIRKIDWERYFSLNNTISVECDLFSNAFKHSKFLAQKVKDAIVDQFRKKYNKRPSVDTKNPDIGIHIFIYKHDCIVSLDSSGESLHRRGYRLSKNRAPLNEVLAAGLVKLSNWDTKTNFIDIMCGAGTILIEAALIAYNIAPGLTRKKYLFYNWRNFKKELWQTVYKNAQDAIIDFKFRIIGNDIDKKSILSATENIKRADLTDKIELVNGSYENFQIPDKPGTIIINPPYNIRMKKDDIILMYKNIGDILKFKFTGYNIWILSGNPEALKYIGLRPDKKIKLNNGPIKCNYNQYIIYKGSRKEN